MFSSDSQLRNCQKQIFTQITDKAQDPINPSISENYRQENNIVLKNIQYPPHPLLTFQGYNFPNFVLDTIKTHGFKSFTPIQAQGLPIIMSGRDFIGISKTGSGKTLAFLIPAILHLLNTDKSLKGPIILVLSPTRELAMQIQNQFRKFLTKSNINWACVYGGIKKQYQRSSLIKNIQILVATPGRLIDFMQQKTVNIQNVTYFVLDQADRMLDMGFLPQIRQICSYLKKPKQSLMFSATWPPQIKQLAQKYLINPVILQIGILQRTINQNIKQQIKIIDDSNKFTELIKDLSKTSERRLVFVQKKIDCESICQDIIQQGIRCVSIHGDKPQMQRDKALMLFKTGKIKVLIATDVASRGLDIPDVNLVINYDFPKQIEDYIHRIGRTGRAGKSGLTISYLKQGEDNRICQDLIKVLKQSGQQIPQEILSFNSWKGGEKYQKYNRNKYNSYNSNTYQTKSSFDSDNWKSPKNSDKKYTNNGDNWRSPKSMKNIENAIYRTGSIKQQKYPYLTHSERNIPNFNKFIYKEKIYHPNIIFEYNCITISIKFVDVNKVNTEAIIVPCLELDKQHRLTRKMNKLLGINFHENLKGVQLGTIKKSQSRKLKTVDHIIYFNLIQEDDENSSFLSYILTKIFKNCQTFGYQSICFYQLGMGKYSLDLQAKTIIYSIFEILQKQDLANLQQIQILVQNEKQYCEYSKLYEKLISNAHQNNILQIQND